MGSDQMYREPQGTRTTHISPLGIKDYESTLKLPVRINYTI